MLSVDGVMWVRKIKWKPARRLSNIYFQGKDLFLDLDEGALKLIDPENLTVLNTQPIHTIRVWGVGRDNGR